MFFFSYVSLRESKEQDTWEWFIAKRHHLELSQISGFNLNHEYHFLETLKNL